MRLDRIDNPLEPFEDIWPQHVLLILDIRHQEELASLIQACMIETTSWEI